MTVDTQTVIMDEKNPRTSDSSLTKEEAGIVEEQWDKAAERAYGTLPSLSVLSTLTSGLTPRSPQTRLLPPALPLNHVLLQQRGPQQPRQRKNRRHGQGSRVQGRAVQSFDFAVLHSERTVRFAAEYVDEEVEWEGYVAEL